MLPHTARVHQHHWSNSHTEDKNQVTYKSFPDIHFKDANALLKTLITQGSLNKIKLLPKVGNSLRSTSQRPLVIKWSFSESHKQSFVLKKLPLCNQGCSHLICILLIICTRRKHTHENLSTTKETTSEQFALPCSEFFTSLSTSQPPQVNYQTQMEPSTFPLNFVLFET